MHCFMCFSSDGKLQMIQSDIDNETIERITFVLPDFLIPESMDPIFICSTCLEQVSFFYTIKKACLQNCSRLKYFNAMLKGTNNLKCNEIRVVLNSDQVSAQSKLHIEFKVNPKSKYLFSSDKQDVTRIKEEDEDYDHCMQQSENYEVNLNHLQDKGASSSSTDSSQYHKNSNVDKKDFNLTSTNSRHEDQPETQRERQKKSFKCTDCHKTYTRQKHLKEHTRVHTGEKPYKCTSCQKAFTKLSTLNAHQLTHTGEKPHECDVCHKTFSQKCNLISHKLIHNNVRPFKCAVCNMAFAQSTNLTRHMLIHTGEKPHQCHLCEYKCTQDSALKRHIRRHTGEKPYSCKHCKKSFTTTSEFKRHAHRLHSNEDSG